MDKMGTPRGLIRYDTENGLEQRLDSAQRWRREIFQRAQEFSGGRPHRTDNDGGAHGLVAL